MSLQKHGNGYLDWRSKLAPVRAGGGVDPPYRLTGKQTTTQEMKPLRVFTPAADTLLFYKHYRHLALAYAGLLIPRHIKSRGT